jgi:hypothetical protein
MHHGHVPLTAVQIPDPCPPRPSHSSLSQRPSNSSSRLFRVSLRGTGGGGVASKSSIFTSAEEKAEKRGRCEGALKRRCARKDVAG